jgi:hypothetical protein
MNAERLALGLALLVLRGRAARRCARVQARATVNWPCCDARSSHVRLPGGSRSFKQAVYLNNHLKVQYSHRRALRRQKIGVRLGFLVGRIAEYTQTIVTLVRRIRCNGDETQKSQPQLLHAQPS